MSNLVNLEDYRKKIPLINKESKLILNIYHFSSEQLLVYLINGQGFLGARSYKNKEDLKKGLIKEIHDQNVKTIEIKSKKPPRYIGSQNLSKNDLRYLRRNIQKRFPSRDISVKLT